MDICGHTIMLNFLIIATILKVLNLGNQKILKDVLCSDNFFPGGNC